MENLENKPIFEADPDPVELYPARGHLRLNPQLLVLATAVSLFTLFGLPSASAQEISKLDQASDLLARNPQTSHLIEIKNRYQITTQFEDLTLLPEYIPGSFSAYSVARSTVLFDLSLRDEDVEDLAAAEAHELTHAGDSKSGKMTTGDLVQACYQSEIDAFSNQSIFWFDRYGISGKPNPKTKLEGQLNVITQIFKTDSERLEVIIRETYRRQCQPKEVIVPSPQPVLPV